MLTDFLVFITAWYNLPFTVLLILGLFMALLQLVGLGGGEEHEAGAHVEHEVDLGHELDLEHEVDLSHEVDLGHELDLEHDIGHEVDLEHGVQVDPEVQADHALEAQAGAGGPSTLSLLAFLGFGKAPLMVVLLLLFEMVGMVGWWLNGMVLSFFNLYPGLVFLLVLPASLLVGGGICSRITRLIGQALPPISTTATRAQALVGMYGTVISPFVDEKYGQVHLRNLDGTLITIFAINPGPQTIQRGDRVLLVAYDATRRHYLVTRSTSA